MFKNYLKIALRNLIRQKGYSAINIIGLAIGISCTMLLSLWIVDELSFDTFHENKDRIFRVLEHQEYSSQSMEVAVTPGPLAAALKENFPEVKRSTRFDFVTKFQIKLEDQVFPEIKGAYVDPDFLEMFTFPIIQGDQKPLNDINSVVLTKYAADKIFGDTDPIGKLITMGEDSKTVSAVIEDVPRNSHLQFHFLQPMAEYKRLGEALEDWGRNSLHTYIEINENADADELNDKITGFIKENSEGAASDLYLQPLTETHLHSSGFVADFSGMGDFSYIIIFGCISLFIIIISCINFISLTTARYSKRAREVGMRKVLGSQRKHLISQFLGESILMVTISLVFAFVIVEFVLPYFNLFTAKKLSLFANFGLESTLLLIGMTALLGIIAGIYPAFMLSSFKPVAVLKGSSLKGQKGGNFRKILVVLQWSLSIILIISTIILFQQLKYMQNKKLGFEKEQILYTRFYDMESYETYKQELLKNPAIESITGALALPHNMANSTSGANWEGRNEEESFLLHFEMVQNDFIDTFNMKMTSGNTFTQENEISEDFGFILNETAIKKMGLEDPIGTKFTLWGMEGKIIGVVEDFHFKSLHNPIEPLVMMKLPDYLYYTVVRVNSNDIAKTKEFLEETVQNFNPEKRIEFKFFDERFDAMYKSEMEMSTVLKLFTGLAIFIACLGLFGLSAFLTELRTREIGIRKVLGADIPNIIFNLSKDFTRWIIIANIIAIPVAYFILRKALMNFAYRIDINITVFIVTFVVSLLLALITVISQTIKAALSNPVKALKYE
ncbi:MAG: ABC transporter permease [Candidatus Cloacimonetes bacterium]|nr:ABC transporter permease [Candidatus Cloacimonadota bacterium]MCF7814012.1 ABC transporter permease [Candidatus Cloacimonadota bacterium]MCF7867938.1 ABC transporter permease [Candidatus Cloacimonadota bacterium]MCF7882869.1 ABC transporter permease [Candidatus Cloacimonadota bacterium]